MTVLEDAVASLSPSRLAVIEDDDYARSELVEVLGKMADGYRDFQSYVADGSGAGVVLLDLGLPGLDGFQAIERLAAMSPSPRLILVSGADRSLLTAAEQIACGLGLHVAGTFSKPADPDCLTAAVAAALRQPTGRPDIPGVPDADIVGALGGQGLDVEFQPKVDLGTGSWTAAEALLRLRHPTVGPVAPPDVVAAFQRAHAADLLEDWLFRRVLAHLSIIRRKVPAFGVSINVLPDSLVRGDLLERLLELTRAADLAPDGITVEIVESGLIDFDPRTRAALARLRLHGFGVAMDDFGVGASNIDRLLGLPLTELKLDRSLIIEARASRSAETMLAGIVRMSQERGVAVTAEGIETDVDRRLALTLGCQFGQGYLFAPSLPRIELLAAMRSDEEDAIHTPQRPGERRTP